MFPITFGLVVFHFFVFAGARAVLVGECWVFRRMGVDACDQDVAGMEEAPARIVVQVHGELLGAVVPLHIRSVHSDYVADLSHHRQVF